MVVAIIQARMGSTRLPGKVMKEIQGKPLISYVLERVKLAKKIDKIILATTTSCLDDVLASHVDSLGYEVYRGSEDDVLSRYYNAADNCNNKSLIVRVTGDCPLIDPDLINKVISVIQSKKVDYVNLSTDFAEGLDVEVFTFSLLKKAFIKAKLNSEREHVTLFFHNNSHLFNMFEVKNMLNESNYRITVDEPEDFLVVSSIIKYFLDKNITPNFLKIKEYLDNHNDIYKINAKITRNEGLYKSLKCEE